MLLKKHFSGLKCNNFDKKVLIILFVLLAFTSNPCSLKNKSKVQILP